VAETVPPVASEPPAAAPEAGGDEVRSGS
jgi:hypothetical protein